MDIHIDTNIYSSAMVGDHKAIDIFQSASTVYLSVIVIGELLSGFKTGTQLKRNREQLYEFLDSPRVVICTICEKTAEHYSNIYKTLKKAGKLIPTNDMWIAASALERGIPLATTDKHFELVPGLILV